MKPIVVRKVVSNTAENCVCRALTEYLPGTVAQTICEGIDLYMGVTYPPPYTLTIKIKVAE